MVQVWDKTWRLEWTDHDWPIPWWGFHPICKWRKFCGKYLAYPLSTWNRDPRWCEKHWTCLLVGWHLATSQWNVRKTSRDFELSISFHDFHELTFHQRHEILAPAGGSSCGRSSALALKTWSGESPEWSNGIPPAGRTWGYRINFQTMLIIIIYLINYNHIICIYI